MTDEAKRVFNLPGYQKGILCEKCNVELTSVERSQSKGGFRERERVCQNCNHKNITHERLLSDWVKRGATAVDQLS